MQSTTLVAGQKQHVTANPIDTNGAPGLMLANPGAFPGPASSDTGVVTVAADTNLQSTITAVAPGTATVTISGVSSTGAVFNTAFSVTVTGGSAVGFNFSFGALF